MTETATQLLHRLTSYSPELEWDQPQADERLVHGFTSNDIAHRPFAYKHYELPRRALPRDLPATTAPATAVLAGTADVPAGALDLAGVARLLYLSCGVTRTTVRNGHRFLFRAAGSAGARFPLEVYLVVPPGNHELPPGVHWYDPEQHALVELAPSAQGETPTIVVTGVPWRTGWRYRERGFRHIYWDTGTMLSQLLALADAAGLPARLYSRFPDAAAAAVVGADGIQEFPVAVVALGDGRPALHTSATVHTGEFEADAIEFPLVTAAQHAGDTTELGDPWPAGAAAEPARGDAGTTLDEVVLRRGSMRRLDPAGRLPLAAVRTSMAAAVRGISVPHWVAVNAVDGLAAGLYRWPELGRAVRTGELRAELFRVGLDQGLPQDACYVAISAVDLSTVDDRAYRESQLAAGMVEGRLHLMAYALGHAASGMTFQDSDLPALLTPDGTVPDGAVPNGTVPDELAGLLWTCVGIPEYTSKPGGKPGEAVEIRMVPPRL